MREGSHDHGLSVTLVGQSGSKHVGSLGKLEMLIRIKIKRIKTRRTYRFFEYGEMISLYDLRRSYSLIFPASLES
jgi:hypothetical protein